MDQRDSTEQEMTLFQGLPKASTNQSKLYTE